MKNFVKVSAAILLGACVYGSPVNHEKFFSNADVTKIDWTKINGKGTSCQTNWLFGLIPFGDNSVPAAVEEAELAKVSYIDTDTVLYLPVFMTRECTNVWGELTPEAKAAAAYREYSAAEEDTDNESISDYAAQPSESGASKTPAAAAPAKKN